MHIFRVGGLYHDDKTKHYDDDYYYYYYYYFLSILSLFVVYSIGLRGGVREIDIPPQFQSIDKREGGIKRDCTIISSSYNTYTHTCTINPQRTTTTTSRCPFPGHRPSLFPFSNLTICPICLIGVLRMKFLLISFLIPSLALHS